MPKTSRSWSKDELSRMQHAVESGVISAELQYWKGIYEKRDREERARAQA